MMTLAKRKEVLDTIIDRAQKFKQISQKDWVARDEAVTEMLERDLILARNLLIAEPK